MARALGARTEYGHKLSGFWRALLFAQGETRSAEVVRVWPARAAKTSPDGVRREECLAGSGRAYEAGGEALPLWEEIWPEPAMKLVGPLAARSPGLRLALALEIERHCSADEILQGRLIDLVAFVDVDGAPGIPVEAGVE